MDDSAGNFQNDLASEVEVGYGLQHRIGADRAYLLVGDMLLSGCIFGIEARNHLFRRAHIRNVALKAPNQLRCAQRRLLNEAKDFLLRVRQLARADRSEDIGDGQLPFGQKAENAPYQIP